MTNGIQVPELLVVFKGNVNRSLQREMVDLMRAGGPVTRIRHGSENIYAIPNGANSETVRRVADTLHFEFGCSASIQPSGHMPLVYTPSEPVTPPDGAPMSDLDKNRVYTAGTVLVCAAK